MTLEAGQASAPHRHPGPVFGYVLEGEYEWAIDDNPAKVLKAGDTFYEPTGCLHRVSKNPSDKNKTRVLAVVLHPQDAKDIVIPEKKSGPKEGHHESLRRGGERRDRPAARRRADPPGPRGHGDDPFQAGTQGLTDSARTSRGGRTDAAEPSSGH